jgi:hypothetical protein
LRHRQFETAILDYLEINDQRPMPFVWIAPQSSSPKEQSIL